MPRPDVSPRPVCRYYNTTSRGCFAGAKCHYLHGDPAEQKYAPYEENKRCRFFDAGYCKRGTQCWFRHVDPHHRGDADQAAGAAQTVCTPESEEDVSCGICFEERPALYGLLSGCSHAFCLTCIRQWRDPEGKDADMTYSGIHKTCPMCRLRTQFIVPSSRFHMQEDPRKAEAIDRYKQSMARVPCRYFVKSRPAKRFCPFGRDCFYQHANPDGTSYEFTEGVDTMMMQWRHRRSGSHPSPHLQDPLQAALEVLEGFAATLSADDTGTRRAMIDMHVRDMVRIIGAAPALATLQQLEMMAGPDEDENGTGGGDGRERGGGHEDTPPSGRRPVTGEAPDAVAREAASGEEASVSRPTTPTALPTSPTTPTNDMRSPSISGREVSYESQDPREPQNTSLAGQLTRGDFAWMMGNSEERRAESSEQDACAS